VRELFALFVIFVLFILLSFIASAGVYFIYKEITNIVFGSLLIVSSASVLWIFIKNFGGDA
jgi:hypothetical protein